VDGSRFDAFVRDLGKGGNRRTLLKGLLGIGGVAAGLSVTSTTDAARRVTPTPTSPACPGQQYWNGTACVCPDNTTICGPACCPSGATCCDSACCHGECYGEELCCPTGFQVCHGSACCTASEVCLSDGSCCAPRTCPTGTPDRLYDCGSASDGCGGTIDCTCPENWLCLTEEPRNFCANLTTTCIPGVTASAYGRIGLCNQGEGFCANSVETHETRCVSLSQALCNNCTSDADCSEISGASCVEAYEGVCGSGATTMCAQLM
jgi:hypothetical protein